MARPKTVTIISWLLIIAAVFSLLTSFSSFNNPLVQELMSKNLLPVPVQYGMLYLGLTVLVICALGMLKGQAWSRILYVIWGTVGLTVNFIISPIKVTLFPGLIVFLIIVYFLYRPSSSQYFR